MIEARLKELPRNHRNTGPRIIRMSDRLNSYLITLTPAEARKFLVMSAREYDSMTCTVKGCEICNEFVDLWESVYDELPEEYKELFVAEILGGRAWRPVRPGAMF